ncbi:MAG TPA: spore germination protein, partial [Firmicutes bacterium]|nr:spore germination protein [Bacillota bacterium]
MLGGTGLAVGLIGLLVLLLATQSFNVPYLWPLLPWDGDALWDVFLR